MQKNDFDCGFIVFHFIYAITRCYQEYPLFPLDKIATMKNPYFKYNESSTIIDIWLQTMFLIRSCQFGTSPINSPPPIHSAHFNHDPIAIKSLTISDNTIQNPEVFSYIICWNEIKDVIHQKFLTFIEDHLIEFRQFFQSIIPFTNSCRMDYQSA